MRNVSRRPFSVLLSPLLAIAAAAQPAPGQSPHAPAPEADAKLLAQACNRFAADLHPRLAAAGAPVASPASIGLALLMLLPGANGDTAAELAAVLRLPETLRGERLETAARELLAGLRRLGAQPDGPQLTIGNDLWTQAGVPVVPAYVATLRGVFAADQHEVRFREDPGSARAAINRHVAKATNQRIVDLLAPDVVTTDTRVILTNTIWLRARWHHPFHALASAQLPFTLANGSTVEVATMQLVEHFAYGEGDGWQCVELPFVAGSLVMQLVVPRAGRALAEAERALLAGDCRLAATRVRVQLPRFRVGGSHRLRDALVGLGLRAAFDPGTADFRGITPQRELVLGDVVHRTWIHVDENGAEAAAATAAVMNVGSAMPADQPKLFAADRPFALVLRERATGLVLFAARVEDPRRDAPPPAKPR